MSFKSCTPHRCGVSVSPHHSAKYLSHPRTWLSLMTEVSGSCLHLYLYLQHMAAHSLHVHWEDEVKSCEKMLKDSWKSLHNLQTSWRDHCHKKKSPLSHYVLNRCHINNFLHWKAQTPKKQFPTVQHEAPTRKTLCVYSDDLVKERAQMSWVTSKRESCSCSLALNYSESSMSGSWNLTGIPSLSIQGWEVATGTLVTLFGGTYIGLKVVSPSGGPKGQCFVFTGSFSSLFSFLCISPHSYAVCVGVYFSF